MAITDFAPTALAANEYGRVFRSANELPTRARQLPDLPVLGTTDADGQATSRTFGELEAAVNLLATHYASTVPPRQPGDATTKLTCALLAPSGLDYAINELALCRIGYAVLFISPSNSAPAVAHLAKATSSTFLFTAPSYLALAQEAQQLANPDFSFDIVDLASPSVYDSKAISRYSPSKAYQVALDPEDEGPLTAFIVHSSGSTGFPKPIYISHQSTCFNIATNFNLAGFTTLPLYHNHGHSCFWRALYSCKILWLFPASDLPLTAPNVMNILDQPQVKVDALFGVPYIYKMLEESEAGLERLKQFKLCLFGGSAMPTELGDRLVDAGVRLAGHYGATEVGQLMTSFRDYETDKEWAYNRPPAALKPYLVWEDRGAGTMEAVVLDGWKGKVVNNRPDNSYATSDLFVKHPTLEAYKFVGRIDDTLVLVTGEKVNPVPLELTLKGESPYVAEAIVFGTERSQAGVLIILSDSVDPSTPRKKLLELIKPALDLANSEAPSHSRLVEEMVVFLSASTVIPRADKGSFIRRKVYVELKDEIDQAYKSLEGVGGGDRRVESFETVQPFVRDLVASVSTSDGLEDETDLFTFGLDSLSATRIRNALQREFNFEGRKLPMNLVFEQPTINLISSFLVAFSNNEAVKELSQVDQMQALIEKYRYFNVPSSLPPDASSPPSPAVALLSGATGSLGANQLSQLLGKPEVKKVFALVRAKSDEDAAARVTASLAEKGLPGGDDSRIVALASDFSQDRLGLSKERYSELEQEVTFAWSVNFNLSIVSFEPHIRGVVNLINLCLSSSRLAAFYFASSVSAVAAYHGEGDVPEEVTDDPNDAQGMGYARSKWVVEKICQIASETTPVRAVVLRVGQMVGSTLDGRWNETPSWLPVDCAASTIYDLVLSEPPAPRTSQCWHVLQPKLVPFSDILDALASTGMQFERVSPSEWVVRLAKGPQDPVVNPTIKLLEFYASKYSGLAPASASAASAPRKKLDCTRTLAASESLRAAPVVGKELMSRYVEAWRSTGFLARPSSA
ncbi:hypothetical protein JCM8547_003885 [Rhodosporidiobolus lusitaniae]